MKVSVPQTRTALLKRSSRYWETKAQNRLCLTVTMTTARSRVTAHLVGTGQVEPVQQRDENVRWDEEPEDVSAADEPVLRAVGVDLSWNADDGHGGLEGGDEGQGDGEAAHAPVRHQELLRGSLPPTRHGVVQPDPCRRRQQEAEDDVVRHREELVVHPFWVLAAERSRPHAEHGSHPSDEHLEETKMRRSFLEAH